MIELSKKLSIGAGLRFDNLAFKYRNILAGENEFQVQNRITVNYKINLNYTASKNLKFFINAGTGFHSNDTRVILSDEADRILPKALGADIGSIVRIGNKLVLKPVLWFLHSDQEFVYVGDAGIIEPGGQTRRLGIDLSARYQLTQWLFADMDLNLTKARSVSEPKGADHVPLAPSFTSIGGLSFKSKKGVSGTLRYRYIKDRPANGDASLIARGYFITDALINLTFKKTEVFISGENIFNVKWNEAQFETESRLRNESSSVTELHFTPGTPIFLKAGISLNF
jgi:outer membrane receptor protein involved in Fe transport